MKNEDVYTQNNRLVKSPVSGPYIGNFDLQAGAKAPYTGLPSLPVQQDKTIKSDNLTLGNANGLNTLSGDKFSVSSRTLGNNISQPALSGLDSRIAYNQTPEAKAQFAENAALSQARYDAARPQAAFQQQALNVPNQPDYSQGIDQYLAILDRNPDMTSIGKMVADKKKRENAKAGLTALLGLQENAKRTGADYAQLAQSGDQFNQGLSLDRQKLNQDAAQQQFTNRLGLNKIAQDLLTGQAENADKDRRFNLDQEKANQPVFQNVKEYNDMGQIVSEKPVALSKYTGQPINAASMEAIQELQKDPNLLPHFIAKFGYNPLR